jgi:hypothetical protein
MPTKQTTRVNYQTGFLTCILMCPADKDKGVPAAQKEPNDPKMSCSYNYEFSPAKCPGVTVFDTNPPKEMTYKEARTR